MPIDTHFHTGLRKYGPIEDHLALMSDNSISNAVLVQHLGEFDNDYLFDVANRYPNRFAVVAALEPTAGQDDLDALIAQPWFRGIRLAATFRSPGPDPLKVWRMLDDANLLASITGDFAGYVSEEFAELVESFPRITFRIEHVGSVQFAHQRPGDPDARRFLQLAEYPNTCLLWAGFWKNSGDGVPYRNAHELLEHSYRAFGPERIMWSGDGTRPNLKPDDYSNDLEFIRTELAFLSDTDRFRILELTGREFFRLDPALLQ
jgi:predicted TIM-barrel fold metal-dependent hydrolase